MAVLTDHRRTVRFPLPHEIVRGSATTIYAPAYDTSDALEAPTGGGTSTVTIYDATNTAVVSAATVVVANSIGQYTLAADTFAQDFGKGWRVAWSLDFSGTVEVHENDAVLVRRQLHPVISLSDVFRVYPQLDPGVTGQPWTRYSRAEMLNQVDEAWTQLMTRFIEEGFRPEWTRSPSSLRMPHMLLSAALIVGAEAILSSDEKLTTEAKRLRNEYQAAYNRMTLDTDRNQDGASDTNGRESPNGGGLWLMGGARRSRVL